MFAQSTRMMGDYDRAAALFTESLELNRLIGDPGMVAVELHNLGHVEMHRSNVDAAESRFAECARAASTDDPYDVSMTDLNHASVSFARGDPVGAAELLHRAVSGLEDNGMEPAPDDAFEIGWLRDRLDGPG